MVDVRIILKPNIDEQLKNDIEFTVEDAFKKYGIAMHKDDEEMIFACKNPQYEQQFCSFVIFQLLLQDWFTDNISNAWYTIDEEHIDLLDEVEETRRIFE